mmetsp:Transcript_98762/g.313431  ORF Transcript_98762/g.313431 Transcript_98762/m.313431 type:complete len:499 (-) Transcript_98762:127-1623(-)
MRFRLTSWSSSKTAASRKKPAEFHETGTLEARTVGVKADAKACDGGQGDEEEEQSTTDGSVTRAADSAGERAEEQSTGETVVLRIPEVFCHLPTAGRSLQSLLGGQISTSSPRGTTCRSRGTGASFQGASAAGAVERPVLSEGVNDKAAVAAAGGRSAEAKPWLPCSLTLTTEALRLSPQCEEVLADNGSRQGCRGSEQCLCTVLLERIVDVAMPSCSSRCSQAQDEDAGCGLCAGSRHQGPGGCGPQATEAGPGCSGGQTALAKDCSASAQAAAELSFSERSTFDGTHQSFLEGTLHTEAEEWFSNSVEVGNFELPPIPLARLPESRSGLPSKGNCQQGPAGQKTHGGVPFWEYDMSNCHPHQGLSGAIPPLPPAACRLPQRTHREMRSSRPSVELLSSMDGPPFPYVLVIWTASSASLAMSSGQTRRLQQGVPVFLCFPGENDAAHACDALLQHRSARLSEWARAAEAGSRFWSTDSNNSSRGDGAHGRHKARPCA